LFPSEVTFLGAGGSIKMQKSGTPVAFILLVPDVGRERRFVCCSLQVVWVS